MNFFLINNILLCTWVVLDSVVDIIITFNIFVTFDTFVIFSAFKKIKIFNKIIIFNQINPFNQIDTFNYICNPKFVFILFFSKYFVLDASHITFPSCCVNEPSWTSQMFHQRSLHQQPTPDRQNHQQWNWMSGSLHGKCQVQMVFISEVSFLLYLNWV